MTRSTVKAASAAALMTASGLALDLYAQSGQPGTDPNQQRQQQPQQRQQQDPSKPVQQPQQPQTQQPQTTQQQMRQNQPGAAQGRMMQNDFRSAKWLSGQDLVNSGGEDVGDMTDMVIERGSGRVSHVVVRSGAVLGIGGRDVLIPYEEFQWDRARQRLVLLSNTDDLRRYPAYSENDWRGLRTSTPPREVVSPAGTSYQPHTDQYQPRKDKDGGSSADSPRRPDGTSSTSGAGRSTTGQTGQTGQTGAGQQQTATGQTSQAGQGRQNTLNEWMWNQQSRTGGDTYGSQWNQAAQERIEGTIQRVSREYSASHGEHTVVEIATADGSVRKVALGPSWFISGSDAALNRGDKITVNAVPIHIATSATVNGRELTLRQADGSAAWSGTTLTAGGESYAAPYYQSVLLSQLRSAKLDCRGADCGTVDDVVLEVESGTVAFLSIDPNENFLGIGDRNHLVPWGVATVSMDGRVRLDVDKQMVSTSMQTPSDVSSLNQSGEVDRIYSAYGVTAPNFHQWPRDRGMGRDPWGAGRVRYDRQDQDRDRPSDPDRPR